ncbi:M23 family metallopeptidase [Desulfonatronovibrio magnus]|uniref:M23 family metallopeptidase n=1 Tax=Desulfonatronovibrio magnus TaxID=698827 RepID=UPI0005EBB3CD|nr:M23 family metallopeptidase [Desulfonatronovibrio magnus]
MKYRFKKSFYILIALLVLIGGGYTYFKFADKIEPVITMQPEITYTNGRQPLTVQAQDLGRGLKEVTVRIIQNGEVHGENIHDFDSALQSFEKKIDLADLSQGQFQVEVIARDRSIVNWGKGNVTKFKRSMVYDTRPPSISVLTNVHNLNQGGSGLIMYSLSKDVVKTGVVLGDYFFPAFQQPDGTYHCMFAFPHDADPANDVPRIMAIDIAGNEQISGFNYHVNARSFRDDRLNIGDNFLRSQMPQFETDFPQEHDPFGIFLRVNREMREDNRRKIEEIATRTSPILDFDGVFMRKPNSAQMAGFADRRTYFYQDREIDRQVHLGVDLASVAQAPIPAANKGQVVFAGPIGIYGQTVVIDHGLGLQTLYAHLSSIDVHEGQTVNRGDSIGRTGTTGLAVGDHLHFEVLISGISVNPIEWWDGSWINNNITSKLN